MNSIKKLLTHALLAIGLLAAPLVAYSQQPQTQTAPIYATNAKYVNGVAPGYYATAGLGLILNIGGGTVFCNGSVQQYVGNFLTMTPSTTNYVYLDPTSNCQPSVKISPFVASDIPISIVVTTSTITSITDVRTPFNNSGGGGGGGGIPYPSGSGIVSVVGGTSWGTTYGVSGNQTTVVTGTLPQGNSGVLVCLDGSGNVTNTACKVPTLINGASVFNININGTTPAAQTNFINVTWQQNSGNVSAEVPFGTSSVKGVVQCDGTTVTCTSGIITAIGGGGGGFSGTVNPGTFAIGVTNNTTLGGGPLSVVSNVVVSTDPISITDTTDPTIVVMTPNGIAPVVIAGSAGWGLGAAVTTGGFYKMPDAPGTGFWFATNASGVVTDTFVASINLASQVTGTLPYTALPALSANQVLGALTGTTPSGLSIPSCSGASNALNYTSGTGFGCITAGGGGAAFTANAIQWATSTSASRAATTADVNTIMNGTDSGSVNNFSVTVSPAPTVADGTIVRFYPAFTNTGAGSLLLSLNGSASNNVTLQGGTGVVAGDFNTGVRASIAWSAANTRWEVLNPQVSLPPGVVAIVKNPSASQEIITDPNGSAVTAPFRVTDRSGSSGSTDFVQFLGASGQLMFGVDANGVISFGGGLQVLIAGAPGGNPMLFGNGNNFLIGNKPFGTASGLWVGADGGLWANATTGGDEGNQTINMLQYWQAGVLTRPIVTGTITLTGAGSDNATITGVNGSSVCGFSPTNATAAATGTALAYVSAVTTNQVTITHTAGSGGTYNILCTLN